MVSVERSEQLHALRQGTGLHFFVREGDRTRALAMHEISRRVREGVLPDPAESWRSYWAGAAFPFPE